MKQSHDSGNPIRRTTLFSWKNKLFQPSDDVLAREVPMEIRVAAEGDEPYPIAVTMRTPGHDVELALGFLFTEGVIGHKDDVAEARRVHDNLGIQNVVEIYLRKGVAFDAEKLSRHVFTGSSCGVCGKQTIDRIMADGLTRPVLSQTVDPNILTGLLEKLNHTQEVFQKTGGLHAAALFDLNGNLLLHREDVGRHNALDKLIGRLLQDDQTPASDCILLLSGRTGFELIQKAVFAGIPVVAGIGAPSSFAVMLAEQFDVSLLGFLRDDRFNLYTTSPQRFTLR